MARRSHELARLMSHGRRRTDLDGPDGSPLRALVVDDAEDDRIYLGVLLRRLGFSVTYAEDGAAATAHIAVEAFDLLVIDCEMPRMNGMELIDRVRLSEYCVDSYALMLTGRTDVETKLAALQAGFDDFLVKSMNETEIVAKIGAARRLIVRHRRLDAAVRELYGLATRDELTGLFNRRYFFAEAERRLAEGAPVGVVFFDLDGFKEVNDSFGHLAGDRILRDVGSLFLRRTRHEDLIARYGGDEFVMLVASKSPDEIERIATRLCNEIGVMQWTFNATTIHVGISNGIAVSTLLERPALELLLEAGDRDLYKNKWLRAHPDVDPALYKYDHGGAVRSTDLLEFRALVEDRSMKKAEEGG
jgi:diguanylate cyclase (GGDEF)-like protein